MFRRSTVRRVEELVLFDVLYEDGTRTSNRKVPGSELVDIEVDLCSPRPISRPKTRKLPRSRDNPGHPIKSFHIEVYDILRWTAKAMQNRVGSVAAPALHNAEVVVEERLPLAGANGMVHRVAPLS